MQKTHPKVREIGSLGLFLAILINSPSTQVLEPLTFTAEDKANKCCRRITGLSDNQLRQLRLREVGSILIYINIDSMFADVWEGRNTINLWSKSAFGFLIDLVETSVYPVDTGGSARQWGIQQLRADLTLMDWGILSMFLYPVLRGSYWVLCFVVLPVLSIIILTQIKTFAHLFTQSSFILRYSCQLWRLSLDLPCSNIQS